VDVINTLRPTIAIKYAFGIPTRADTKTLVHDAVVGITEYGLCVTP
jgi:hypothetical protein